MELVAILADEIGHYYSNVKYDLVDYSTPFNIKQEKSARKWCYNKLLPFNKLKQFIADKDAVYYHEIAEEFEVPEEIVNEVINMYRVQGQL